MKINSFKEYFKEYKNILKKLYIPQFPLLSLKNKFGNLNTRKNMNIGDFFFTWMSCAAKMI